MVSVMRGEVEKTGIKEVLKISFAYSPGDKIWVTEARSFHEGFLNRNIP